MQEEDTDKLELILNGVQEFPDADLTDWERQFVEDTAKRYEEYGTRIRVSEKQWAVLDRIYGKLPL